MRAASYSARVGWYEALSGDLDEGERLALTGIRELQEHGDRRLGSALAHLAEIRILQARYAEALELADEAERQGGSYAREPLIAANSVRARAHACLGATHEARAAAATAVSAAESADSVTHQALAQYALAETLAVANELPTALAAAQQAARLYEVLERGLQMERAKTLAEAIERRVGSRSRRRPLIEELRRH